MSNATIIHDTIFDIVLGETRVVPKYTVYCGDRLVGVFPSPGLARKAAAGAA